MSSALLDAAGAAARLLARPEMAGRRASGSALELFPVSGLSGHLLRAITTVEARRVAPRISARQAS